MNAMVLSCTCSLDLGCCSATASPPRLHCPPTSPGRSSGCNRRSRTLGKCPAIRPDALTPTQLRTRVPLTHLVWSEPLHACPLSPASTLTALRDSPCPVSCSFNHFPNSLALSPRVANNTAYPLNAEHRLLTRVPCHTAPSNPTRLPPTPILRHRHCCRSLNLFRASSSPHTRAQDLPATPAYPAPSAKLSHPPQSNCHRKAPLRAPYRSRSPRGDAEVVGRDAVEMVGNSNTAARPAQPRSEGLGYRMIGENGRATATRVADWKNRGRSRQLEYSRSNCPSAVFSATDFYIDS